MGQVKKISLKIKESALLIATVLLTAAATYFASSACVGIFHEPKVPQKFLEER